MKKLFIIAALLFPGLFAQAQDYDKDRSKKESVYRPFQVTLIYPLSTNGFRPGRVTNTLSLNIIGGNHAGLKGIEIGGVYNILKYDMKGLQAAGFMNIVGRQVKGLQFAGFMNVGSKGLKGFQGSGFMNIAGLSSKGIQAAGFMNVANGGLKGLQAAGFMNVAGQQTKGIQLSGFMNVASKGLKGIQGSGFMNISGQQAKGLQAAGFMNVASRGLKGIQAAGFMNIAGVQPKVRPRERELVLLSHPMVKDFYDQPQKRYRPGSKAIQVAGFMNIAPGEFKGIQVSGFMNVTGKLHGLQIGVINIADTVASGIPIGLISFVKGGYYHVEVGTHETMKGFASLKIGVPAFYNIFSAGVSPEGDRMNWAVGYGIGATTNPKRRMSINVDLISYQRFLEDMDDLDLNLLNRASASLNFRLGKAFTLFGGVAANILVNDRRLGLEGEIPENLVNTVFFDETYGAARVRIYPGFQAGIRL